MNGREQNGFFITAFYNLATTRAHDALAHIASRHGLVHVRFRVVTIVDGRDVDALDRVQLFPSHDRCHQMDDFAEIGLEEVGVASVGVIPVQVVSDGAFHLFVTLNKRAVHVVQFGVIEHAFFSVSHVGNIADGLELGFLKQKHRILEFVPVLLTPLVVLVDAQQHGFGAGFQDDRHSATRSNGTGLKHLVALQFLIVGPNHFLFQWFAAFLRWVQKNGCLGRVGCHGVIGACGEGLGPGTKKLYPFFRMAKIPSHFSNQLTYSFSTTLELVSTNVNAAEMHTWIVAQLLVEVGAFAHDQQTNALGRTTGPWHRLAVNLGQTRIRRHVLERV